MAGFSVICSECKKEYLVPSRDKLAYKNHFCSKECRSKWQSKNFCGENNSNFGKKWKNNPEKLHLIEAQRKRASELLTPDRRVIIGNQHRGIKRSQESIRKQKSTTTMNGSNLPGRYSHTEEDKIRIGKLSAAKFEDSEYRKKLPKILAKMIATKAKNGVGVSYEEMPDFRIYQKESNWITNMISYLSKEDFELFKSAGFFHPTKNKNGVVRDHRVTRKTGFINGVFPELLRHPCNCKIRYLKENSKKGCRLDDFLIEELFILIQNYTEDWREQQDCLQRISQYQQGERWIRPSLYEDHVLSYRKEA
jgi:hypothetical protein